MKRLLAAAAALMCASAPAAAEPNISAALKEMLTEYAAGAYMIGACEARLAPADVDRLARTSQDLDSNPETLTEAELWLSGLYAKLYTDGRIEGRKLALSAGSCATLIAKQSELLDAARLAYQQELR